jgi:hypothetical protein
MDSRPEEERDEVTEVSITYACANPRTVMIMSFNADSTLRAMERPWRSQNIAGVAVT